MIITQFLILKVGTSHFLLDLLAPPCNTQGLFLSLSLSDIFGHLSFWENPEDTVPWGGKR